MANRNFLIHQYDEINRALTWQTLAVDLLEWQSSLQAHFIRARATVDDHSS